MGLKLEEKKGYMLRWFIQNEEDLKVHEASIPENYFKNGSVHGLMEDEILKYSGYRTLEITPTGIARAKMKGYL